jgi:hypothetical protein
MRLCRKRYKGPLCHDIVAKSPWEWTLRHAPCPSVERGDGRASMPHQREKVWLVSCQGLTEKSPDFHMLVNREFVLPSKKV